MLYFSRKPLNLINIGRSLVLAVLFNSAIVSAQSNDYKVEVIVFERLHSDALSESHHYEAPFEMKHEANYWRLSPSLLVEEAELLNDSSQYSVQRHYAWGVESLPYEQSANYTVIEPDSQGYIKVYADHLLFTNIDLDYKGYRMHEKRRLKLNEKHYFDHPKFGLLMQVSRIAHPQTSASEQGQ